MRAEEYKECRKALGLTQEELAKRLGVSRKTVVLRESGKTITKEAQLAIIGILSDSMKSDWSTWGEKNSEWIRETFPK